MAWPMRVMNEVRHMGILEGLLSAGGLDVRAIRIEFEGGAVDGTSSSTNTPANVTVSGDVVTVTFAEEVEETPSVLFQTNVGSGAIVFPHLVSTAGNTVQFSFKKADGTAAAISTITSGTFVQVFFISKGVPDGNV